MRIIAGTHRSRRILAPADAVTTRPITDRVKQSLFDRLAVRGDVDGGAAVDLFCGTGSLGLEALSRGVEHCTFIERNRAVRGLLEENLATLGLADRATVFAADAMGGVWITMLPRRPVSLVFCDPPYKMTTGSDNLRRMLELIETIGQVMADQGTLVLRTDDQADPTAVEGFDGPDSYQYGSMATHLYTRRIAGQAGRS